MFQSFEDRGDNREERMMVEWTTMWRRGWCRINRTAAFRRCGTDENYEGEQKKGCIRVPFIFTNPETK